jgi:superfamily I DNA/RNA helicase
MLRAVSDDVRLHHRRLSDFAVLYRSRSAALTLQKQVADSGLPYQVVGDGSPYEQPQIQAVIALLRAATANEPLALEGFGSAQRRLLTEELAAIDQAIPSALVEKLIAILGFESNPELQQFASVLVRFKNVQSVLEYIDTIGQQGFYDAAADAITLSTIHAAKGLEFPVVFVIGVEEGVLPSRRGDEAEERRLFYVAVTRAREVLTILHARNRGGQKTEVSHFLPQLSNEVLERMVDPDIDKQLLRIAKRAAKNSQTRLF